MVPGMSEVVGVGGGAETNAQSKDMVHIYNGILLSYKKGWDWVICRDVAVPRVWHTK